MITLAATRQMTHVKMTKDFSKNGSVLVHIPLPTWGDESVFIHKRVSYREEGGRLVFRYRAAEIMAPDYFEGTDITSAHFLRVALTEATRQATILDRRYPVGAIAQGGVHFRSQRRRLDLALPVRGSTAQGMADRFDLVRSSSPDGEVEISVSMPRLVPGVRVWVAKYVTKEVGRIHHYRSTCIGAEDNYDGDRGLSYWRGFAHLLDGAVRQAELLEREFPSGAVVGNFLHTPSI